jgi:hypothetical protein
MVEISAGDWETNLFIYLHIYKEKVTLSEERDVLGINSEEAHQ